MHRVVLVAVLTALAEGCARGPGANPEVDAEVARAWPALAEHAESWADALRANRLVRGRLSPSEATFATKFDDDWQSVTLTDAECVVGGRSVDPARFGLYVRAERAAATAARLRELRGRMVWFAADANGSIRGEVDGMHACDDSAAEFAAVRALLSLPLRELAASVARPHAAVEAAVAALRAGGTADAALRCLEPWDESMLPGLLFAMMRSLEHRHDGEAMRPEYGHGLIHGYHTETPCAFDLLAFAALALRGALDQAAPDDEGRAAEARGLAIWLHFRALGMTPRAVPFAR